IEADALPATQSGCGEPASRRSRSRALQDRRLGWAGFGVLPGRRCVQVHWILKERKTLNAVALNSALGLAARTRGAAAGSRIAMSVGGISFGVSAPGDLRLALDSGLTEFACDTPVCDGEIEAACAPGLRLSAAAPAFQSGGLWSAYREGYGLSFYFQTAY